MRILLVDDQTLFRESIKSVLEMRNPCMQVVAQAADGKEGLELAERLHPDIILMDVRMPVMDGVESARLIRNRCPEAKIIMLTTFDDDEYVFEALKAGAAGYLLKDIPPAGLEAAIISVYNGGVLMSPEIADKVVNKLSNGPPTKSKSDYDSIREIITERELEILQAIAQGKGNREIAKEFYLSEGTVRNYVSNIYAKLNVKDRAEAILYAIEKKIV
ncbi:MAG: response regulator transcription factor [Firmicutes bacterium]|nr:response regulator transcription factor [Bacillota bacterium]